MSMSKQDFIALADAIRYANMIAKELDHSPVFTEDAIQELAAFCRSANSNFMRDRWLGYIAGENGKSGGRVKAA